MGALEAGPGGEVRRVELAVVPFDIFELNWEGEPRSKGGVGRTGVSFEFVFLVVEVVIQGMEGIVVGVDCKDGGSAVRGGRVGLSLRSKKYKNKSVSSFLISPFLVGSPESFSPLSSAADVVELKGVVAVMVKVEVAVVVLRWSASRSPRYEE